MIPARCLLVALLVACAPAGAKEVYRWTDANGKVHYGEQPPAGAKGTSAVADRLSSPSGSVASGKPQKPAAGDPPKAAGSITPVMYATEWCGYCAQARKYFAKKGIRYVEHDVEKSASANAEFRRLGGKGVPLILVGEQKMNGFSEPAMEAMLAKAAKK